MLILTRKVGESIMIGDSVEVKVLGLRAGQIKIGIEAPQGPQGPPRRDLRAHPGRAGQRTPGGQRIAADPPRMTHCGPPQRGRAITGADRPGLTCSRTPRAGLPVPPTPVA